jgi:hypothetical protein
MAVALDADILLLLLNPEAKPPKDPATNELVERAKERIESLVAKLANAKTKIVIPTPVLSEILIKAGLAGPKYIDILRQHSQFKIGSFDERSAIECAAQLADAKSQGDKKAGSASTWAKVKFDRPDRCYRGRQRCGKNLFVRRGYREVRRSEWSSGHETMATASPARKPTFVAGHGAWRKRCCCG